MQNLRLQRLRYLALYGTMEIPIILATSIPGKHCNNAHNIKILEMNILRQQKCLWRYKEYEQYQHKNQLGTRKINPCKCIAVRRRC